MDGQVRPVISLLPLDYPLPTPVRPLPTSSYTSRQPALGRTRTLDLGLRREVYTTDHIQGEENNRTMHDYDFEDESTIDAELQRELSSTPPHSRFSSPLLSNSPHLCVLSPQLSFSLTLLSPLWSYETRICVVKACKRKRRS
jgi:hypothetical protein